MRSMLTTPDEERHLVRFFGNDYVNYRKRVGTGLPFFIGTA
jgi:protein-S-isoprenylcysteine O-methyltransferase